MNFKLTLCRGGEELSAESACDDSDLEKLSRDEVCEKYIKPLAHILMDHFNNSPTKT